MLTYPFSTIIYIIKPYDNIQSIAQKFRTDISSITSINPGLDFRYLTVGQPIYICPDTLGSVSYNPDDKINLSNIIRMTWEQHVFWTRMSIISVIDNLPDVKPVSERLLRNATDFEIVLEPFYGNEIASKFGELIRQHLIIAAELVTKTKEGDTVSAANAERKWYGNAEEISVFLSNINPYWSADEWREMFYKHLSLTKSEAVDIFTKEYSSSIDIFDEIEKQALQMADIMVKGIINQFSNCL